AQTATLNIPPKFNVLGSSGSARNGGKSVVAGAPGWQDGAGKGSVDLFAKPASGWKTTSKFNERLTAADGKNQDDLGYSVSAIADVVVSGTPYATIGSNPKEGAAYALWR